MEHHTAKIERLERQKPKGKGIMVKELRQE